MLFIKISFTLISHLQCKYLSQSVLFNLVFNIRLSFVLSNGLYHRYLYRLGLDSLENILLLKLKTPDRG